MANSDTLRRTLAGNIKNSESTTDEKLLRFVIHRLQEELDLYGIETTLERNYRLSRIAPHYQFECSNSAIRPDGGVLLYNDKPILFSEMKKQGTNDKRNKEGKSVQAMGNAIERSGKNISAAAYIMRNEDIFPYVVFAHGCDFEKGSYIRDRITPFNGFKQFNQVYNYWDNRLPIPSFFVKESSFTFEEMFEPCMKMAWQSVCYWEQKG